MLPTSTTTPRMAVSLLASMVRSGAPVVERAQDPTPVAHDKEPDDDGFPAALGIACTEVRRPSPAGSSGSTQT